MKIKTLIILTALTFMNLYCSGIEVTEYNVKKELQLTADNIRKDKNNIYKLDNRIIGKKGYFYIIRSTGEILYHPKKALINNDFSKYQFIQKILKTRNGCLSFNPDGSRRFVFFTEINSNEILCLTIESVEFIGHVENCDSNIEEKL